MPKKITDLKNARQAQRKKTGWTPKEIKEALAKEREAYEKLPDQEPDDLVSGKDMSKILEEPDDDQEDQTPSAGS